MLQSQQENFKWKMILDSPALVIRLKKLMVPQWGTSSHSEMDDDEEIWKGNCSFLFEWHNKNIQTL